jgi:hypothetical protein
MRHRGGPTKRLAPTIGPDALCPHIFTEDEGIQLEIECTDCGGAHDLSNSRCLLGVMNVVCGGAVPETVILKRYTHKRYRKNTVRLVSIAASELSSLNRALATPDQASDKECRTCFASKQQVVSDMKRRLLENPRSYVLGGALLVEDIKRAHAAVACVRASACINSGLSASAVFGGDL